MFILTKDGLGRDKIGLTAFRLRPPTKCEVDKEDDDVAPEPGDLPVVADQVKIRDTCKQNGSVQNALRSFTPQFDSLQLKDFSWAE